jgi:hypothetical protein
MSRLLALAVLATLSGCASSGAVTPGQDFSLSVGQQVALSDGSTLRYAGIANDSRCPPDVQCIRAGDADVLFDHTAHQGSTLRVTLNTERLRATAIGAWHLQLIDIAPGAAPRVSARIEATGAAP